MPDPSDLPASAAIPAPPDEFYPNPPLVDYAGIPPEALDEQQRIVCDLPCRSCGYNLFMIHSRANCPECGTAAHWSLVGDLLRFADAEWVQALAKGLAWLLVTTLLTFVLAFAVGIAAGGLAATGNSTEIVEVFAFAIGILGTLAAAYGYWLITTPEPLPSPDLQPADSVRRWTRGLLLTTIPIALFSLALEMVSTFTADPTNPTWTTLDSIITAIDTLNSLIIIAGWFCLAVILRRLARRAPHAGMARETTIQIWSWASLLGLAFLSGVVIFALVTFTGPNAPGFGGPGSTGLIAALGCGGGLFALALGIWALVLLIRYYNLFKKHAGYARFRIPEHRPPRL
ncbi:MAG: hypothetical protein AAF911_10670 [Planctomycetota bacterium]